MAFLYPRFFCFAPFLKTLKEKGKKGRRGELLRRRKEGKTASLSFLPRKSCKTLFSVQKKIRMLAREAKRKNREEEDERGREKRRENWTVLPPIKLTVFTASLNWTGDQKNSSITQYFFTIEWTTCDTETLTLQHKWRI